MQRQAQADAARASFKSTANDVVFDAQVRRLETKLLERKRNRFLYLCRGRAIAKCGTFCLYDTFCLVSRFSAARLRVRRRRRRRRRRAVSVFCFLLLSSSLWYCFPSTAFANVAARRRYRVRHSVQSQPLFSFNPSSFSILSLRQRRDAVAAFETQSRRRQQVKHEQGRLGRWQIVVFVVVVEIKVQAKDERKQVDVDDGAKGRQSTGAQRLSSRSLHSPIISFFLSFFLFCSFQREKFVL